jgi:hypothetical protein
MGGNTHSQRWGEVLTGLFATYGNELPKKIKKIFRAEERIVKYYYW